MEFDNLTERVINLKDQTEKSQIEAFLCKQGIKLDHGLEYLVGIYSAEHLVSTGGIEGKTLRCIAVDGAEQGTGVINKLISHLMHIQYERGNTHLFIYTKPESAQSFAFLGFKQIAKVDSKVVLLENRPDGIGEFVKTLAKQRRDGEKIAGIVVNCNPFTLGHQHLIETAAKQSNIVHIFVVFEDKSVFPAEVRYQLVVEGTRHLRNVIVHQGKDYIISSATFPSYFMKDEAEVVKTHAMLDLTIFGDYIAPALQINQRFVGEEPYCPVTNTYNQVMKSILPQKGIEVIEIPRQRINQQIISASAVRRHLKTGDLAQLKELVPPSTYNYLQSPEAKGIIEKIKISNERH